MKAEREDDVMKNLQEFVDKYNIKIPNDKEQESLNKERQNK